MAATLVVTLSAPGVSSLTLQCESAVYPYVGRRIEREVVEHVFRDGSSTAPEDAATRLLIPRPFSPVGEPLSLAVPYAPEEVAEWFLALGESDDAEATVVDGFGTRVFRVYSVDVKPRTNVPGRFDCVVEMKRIE